MKLSKSISTAVIFVALATAATSTAEANRRGERQRNQVNRIREGAQSGELTRKETRQLMRGQKRVGEARKEAAEDGKISGRERAKIERMQNRQSRKIFRNKHDDQNRPRAEDGSGRDHAEDGPHQSSDHPSGQ